MKLWGREMKKPHCCAESVAWQGSSDQLAFVIFAGIAEFLKQFLHKKVEGERFIYRNNRGAGGQHATCLSVSSCREVG